MPERCKTQVLQLQKAEKSRSSWKLIVLCWRCPANPTWDQRRQKVNPVLPLTCFGGATKDIAQGKPVEPYILPPLSGRNRLLQKRSAWLQRPFVALCSPIVVEDTAPLPLKIVKSNVSEKKWLAMIDEIDQKFPGCVEPGYSSLQAEESFRKMLCSPLSDDVLVILIKLLTGCNNMRAHSRFPMPAWKAIENCRPEPAYLSDRRLLSASRAVVKIHKIEGEHTWAMKIYSEPDIFTNELSRKNFNRQNVNAPSFSHEFPWNRSKKNWQKQELQYEIKGRSKSVHSNLDEDQIQKQGCYFWRNLWTCFCRVRVILDTEREDETAMLLGKHIQSSHDYFITRTRIVLARTLDFKPRRQNRVRITSTPLVHGAPAAAGWKFRIRTRRMEWNCLKEGYAGTLEYKEGLLAETALDDLDSAYPRSLLENPESKNAALDFVDEFKKLNLSIRVENLWSSLLPVNSSRFHQALATLDFAFGRFIQNIGSKCHRGQKWNHRLVPLSPTILPQWRPGWNPHLKQNKPPKEAWLELCLLPRTQHRKSKSALKRKPNDVGELRPGKEILQTVNFSSPETWHLTMTNHSTSFSLSNKIPSTLEPFLIGLQKEWFDIPRTWRFCTG